MSPTKRVLARFASSSEKHCCWHPKVLLLREQRPHAHPTHECTAHRFTSTVTHSLRSTTLVSPTSLRALARSSLTYSAHAVGYEQTVLLAGSKIDLSGGAKQVVDYYTAQKFAKLFMFETFEFSAKNSIGVEEIFHKMLQDIMKRPPMVRECSSEAVKSSRSTNRSSLSDSGKSSWKRPSKGTNAAPSKTAGAVGGSRGCARHVSCSTWCCVLSFDFGLIRVLLSDSICLDVDVDVCVYMYVCMYLVVYVPGCVFLCMCTCARV
jgi:Ras family